MDEVTGNGIEHAVDVSAASWGRVELGNIDILIDADANGDAGTGEHLGNGNLHDDNVHVGQSREVPVVGGLAHVVLVLVGIEYGGTEQLTGIFLVLLAVVLGQQLLITAILLLETLDGLQHEGIDNLLVVVPVQALLLQQLVEVGVLLDEGAVDLAPHLAVGSVVVLLALHVFLVNLAVLNLL